MRASGRGKRWLLLRRWKTVRGLQRQELQQRFAADRRLLRAYVLREQLDRDCLSGAVHEYILAA
jgi:hypothetical protein